MSNFSFFNGEWEVLAKLGESAERNVYVDPNTTISKLRLLSETIAKAVLASDNIKEFYDTNQIDRLNTMQREGLAEPEILDIFHLLRKKGNRASHDGSYGIADEAKQLLALAYQLSIWFMEVYVDWEFSAPKFVEPTKEADSSALQEQIKQLQAEIDKKEKTLEKQLEVISEREVEKEVRIQRKEKSRNHLRKHQLTEAQTRTLIDDKLRAAGWEVDTDTINFKKHKTMPEKNRNKAIAEWKIGNQYADYALFIGEQLVGLVEAKAKHRDIPAALESQAKNYARNVIQIEGIQLLPPSGEYKVPFIYASNGRQFLRQLEDQSGIWFWDTRHQTKRAHALEGWHSPEDLKLLLDVNDEKADKRLKEEDITKFGLRDYQQKAVLSAEKALMEGARKMLVAMATGTGKTRTAIALMYRLVKAKKCRRILFLVDRNSLGQQTEDALKDSKMENGLPFSSIYDVKTLEDITPDVETKVQIATVQGMVRRLFYSDGEKLPSVGQYDFIIVDEAHRGYTSDKEMADEELLFRNQNDYVSQYRRVIDYFDASVLGLTATPALHTTEIFGNPIYKYSYTEAVLDGYLVDHEPPYLFETELKENGITFNQGEEVEVYDPEEGEIILEQLEDELKFEVEHFNKKVITEGFNRAVLTKLTDYIDPESDEKTLIFAATNQHADLIVRVLKEAFAERGDEVSDDAIVKITGSIYRPNEMIKRFKNEKLPNIVVTVDLLTTGIDVPAITNIVFLRRIKSRILYDQMLGRATRLCSDINKEVFRIFDAVGIYHQLQKYTDMKPVVKKQNVSIGDLQEAYIQSETKDEAKHFLDQLVAKVQRKKQKLDEAGKKEFEKLSKGVSIDKFAHDIQDYTQKQVETHSVLFEYIEKYRTEKELQVISKHGDQVTAVNRGYGEGNTRPVDYLDGFIQYIRDNMNEIPALQIICQRPKDLTRNDLREIIVLLSTEGYKENDLRNAWKQAKNESIAADIISFIRQAALGEALVDQETRVKNAMKKVYTMHDWTPRQKKWLQRIETQLLKFPVLAPTPEDAFSEEPFKSQGGYTRLKKELGEDEVNQLVYAINEGLYAG
ncbi:type I restriction-modification system endonuclease [Bacillus pseudomycoides]|uniref:type I restriction-modification system endonuclease n=1 Tax=Bacillus pseudomycoides TaxID=64104 RepID=UPI000BF5A3E5|nr:type I restriction-modification system endonuclease [Bacillus pseudomycoides]MED1621371.1 type I restriction-modification system endonuclease [Bacillus pseudomycoides]PEP42557.1 type I restriction-modification system endonuclease [Bacillus pseudomycoides]PEP44205.1 type I restriction-modification system endonuclease [Bacillus pseudomycoides]